MHRGHVELPPRLRLCPHRHTNLERLCRRLRDRPVRGFHFHVAFFRGSGTRVRVAEYVFDRHPALRCSGGDPLAHVVRGDRLHSDQSCRDILEVVVLSPIHRRFLAQGQRNRGDDRMFAHLVDLRPHRVEDHSVHDQLVVGYVRVQPRDVYLTFQASRLHTLRHANCHAVVRGDECLHVVVVCRQRSLHVLQRQLTRPVRMPLIRYDLHLARFHQWSQHLVVHLSQRPTHVVVRVSLDQPVLRRIIRIGRGMVQRTLHLQTTYLLVVARQEVVHVRVEDRDVVRQHRHVHLVGFVHQRNGRLVIHRHQDQRIDPLAQQVLHLRSLPHRVIGGPLY